MQSKASTVAQYLAELPPDRREAVAAVRRVILDNLDSGFEEGMQYGMIGYYVPHKLFPAGYHCDPKQPLPFAALASQKGHMSLYLMGLNTGPSKVSLTLWFHQAWTKAGKKLDMGQSCVRFKKVDELALDVLAEAMRRMPAAKYIQNYEAARADHAASPRKKASAAAKPKAGEKTAKKKVAAVKKKVTKKQAGQ